MSTFMANKGNIVRKWYILDAAGKPLGKTAATAAQHTLSAAERRTNLQGVYRVLDEQQVAGKRILLVDDVITTGSTMLACAQALRQAGAIWVGAVGFAHPFPSSSREDHEPPKGF